MRIRRHKAQDTTMNLYIVSQYILKQHWYWLCSWYGLCYNENYILIHLISYRIASDRRGLWYLLSNILYVLLEHSAFGQYYDIDENSFHSYCDVGVYQLLLIVSLSRWFENQFFIFPIFRLCRYITIRVGYFFCLLLFHAFSYIQYYSNMKRRGEERRA